MKWLVLDVGNTHTVAGVYKGQTLEHHVRFRTDPYATPDEYRTKLEQLFATKEQSEFSREIARAIVSSVVPAVDRVIEAALKPIPILFIRASTRREYDLKLPFPEQLGADRLANITGALALSSPPFLIIDAGTATTFCLVNKASAYIGGCITPGLETGWKALQARAAKLFAVDLKRPETSIGTTTESQLQSGVLLSYETLIEGMTDRMLQDAARDYPEFDLKTNRVTLFATGGCINLLKLSGRFRIEPDLTLLGLLRYGQLTQ